MTFIQLFRILNNPYNIQEFSLHVKSLLRNLTVFVSEQDVFETGNKHEDSEKHEFSKLVGRVCLSACIM
jgi:hypothetical protein